MAPSDRDDTAAKDAASPPAPDDTRVCPLCGETIKKVAIRCKHCHGDLSGPVEKQSLRELADFDRAAPALATAPLSPSEDFERRFLDFAYATTEPLTAISVAHALKIPIALADERLESLAASDVIHRDVDDEGGIFFSLPGKRGSRSPASAGSALVHPRSTGELALRASASPPSEAAATAGLVLNLCMPGVGSIVAGKPAPGIAQLAMVLVGLPLCFVFIGFPMIFAAWIWALVTSGNALHESRLAEADRRAERGP